MNWGQTVHKGVHNYNFFIIYSKVEKNINFVENSQASYNNRTSSDG